LYSGEDYSINFLFHSVQI